MKQLLVILMEVLTSSTKTTGIENNHKISDHKNKGKGGMA